jgi:protein kinase A/protein kinase X
MEYLNGGELFRLIRRNHRLTQDVARFFSGEVVLALGHLHSMDIVYRDLKPENILIDCEGHLKITDFGFAKVVPLRTWTVCGTPEYVAPEIISTKGHGKPVDWWALGILVFEMLAGHSPFVGKSSQEIHAKVLGQDPNFPKHFKSTAVTFIGELLVKDKARRLGSGASGAQEIKDHSWFESVDWDVMVGRKYSPLMAPQVRGPDDTSLFDDYPEEPIDLSATSHLSAEEQRQFEGF